MERKDQTYIPLIVTVSIVIPLVVAILMLLPSTESASSFTALPLFHAILNGLTAISLLVGYILIRSKRRKQHQYAMITALALSIIFLVSYVIYHFNTGHTSYGGEGAMRTIYFFILITHICLAVVIIPMALLSVYRGLTNQIDKHRKIARWTFPIWLYVAVTGVLVYLLMRPYYGV